LSGGDNSGINQFLVYKSYFELAKTFFANFWRDKTRGFYVAFSGSDNDKVLVSRNQPALDGLKRSDFYSHDVPPLVNYNGLFASCYDDSLAGIDTAANPAYYLPVVHIDGNGFGRPCNPGAKVMRRKSHGFFYALRFMVGVLGSREACRFLDPVDQPDTFTALSLVAPVGGLTTIQESSMNTQVALSALQISDIAVRQDSQGRYCLNDLHKASGNNPKHKPTNFLRLETTKALRVEIDSFSDMRSFEIIQGKGTYVVKELVYAYAMWISASFSLKVIRAYDALQHPSPSPLPVTASAISNLRTRLIISIEHGQVVSSTLLPDDACMVSPGDPVSLRTLMTEFVPFEQLGLVSDVVYRRMAAWYRHSSAAVKVADKE
jgi:hypothetical protein